MLWELLTWDTVLQLLSHESSVYYLSANLLPRSIQNDSKHSMPQRIILWASMSHLQVATKLQCSKSKRFGSLALGKVESILEMPNDRFVLQFRAAFAKSVVRAPHANGQWPNPLAMEDTHSTTGTLHCYIVCHCGMEAWLNSWLCQILSLLGFPLWCLEPFCPHFRPRRPKCHMSQVQRNFTSHFGVQTQTQAWSRKSMSLRGRDLWYQCLWCTWCKTTMNSESSSFSIAAGKSEGSLRVFDLRSRTREASGELWSLWRVWQKPPWILTNLWGSEGSILVMSLNCIYTCTTLWDLSPSDGSCFMWKTLCMEGRCDPREEVYLITLYRSSSAKTPKRNTCWNLAVWLLRRFESRASSRIHNLDLQMAQML